MIFERLAEALHADRRSRSSPGSTARTPARSCSCSTTRLLGDLGTPGLNVAAGGEARALLAVGETAIRTFGEDGEPVGVEVRLFIAAHAPKPAMYVFGAIDFSRAMARIGKYLGYTVTVSTRARSSRPSSASPTPTRSSSRGPTSFSRTRRSTSAPR